MSYLRYLCFFAHSLAQHILCCVFFCLRLVASFSGLSMFSNVYPIKVIKCECYILHCVFYNYTPKTIQCLNVLQHTQINICSVGYIHLVFSCWYYIDDNKSQILFKIYCFVLIICFNFVINECWFALFIGNQRFMLLSHCFT